jgi:hypothetical protein
VLNNVKQTDFAKVEGMDKTLYLPRAWVRVHLRCQLLLPHLRLPRRRLQPPLHVYGKRTDLLKVWSCRAFAEIAILYYKIQYVNSPFEL